MKKIQYTLSGMLIALSLVLFVVLAVWNPCSYALIVPSLLAIIGFSMIIIAKVNAKNENKKLAVNN